jgi:hypothetical protein
MRKNILLGAALGALLILGSAGGAFAGEKGGNGEYTQGPLHAKSACSYSGLEDGAEGGTPGPGNVQNWGHTKDVPGVSTTRGASDVYVPGIGEWGCNAHLHPNIQP